MTSSERWRRLEETLTMHSSVELRIGRTLLQRYVEGDEALRLEVESLLAQPEGFLSKPAFVMTADDASAREQSFLDTGTESDTS